MTFHVFYMLMCKDCGHIWISRAKKTFCPRCDSVNVEKLKETKIPANYLFSRRDGHGGSGK